MPEEVARYVVGVVRKTRVLDGVMLGASSRAAIHLMSATKANARLEGRDTVTIEDVRTMAHYVLPHRLITEDEDLSTMEALQTALDYADPLGAVEAARAASTASDVSRRAPARARAAPSPGQGAPGTRTSPRGRSAARLPR